MPPVPSQEDFGPRTFPRETVALSPEEVWRLRVEHAVAWGQPIPPLALSAAQVNVGRFERALLGLATSPRPFMSTLDGTGWARILASAPAAVERWTSHNPFHTDGILSRLGDAVERSEPQAFTLLPALLAVLPPAATRAAVETPAGTCTTSGRSPAVWLEKVLAVGPWLRLAEEAAPVACAGLEDLASSLSALAAPAASPWSEAIHQNILAMALLQGPASAWWEAGLRHGDLSADGSRVLAQPAPSPLYRPRTRPGAYAYTTVGILVAATIGVMQEKSRLAHCRRCLIEAEDQAGSAWFKALCEEAAATPEDAWPHLLNAIVACASPRRWQGESERDVAASKWCSLQGALAARRALLRAPSVPAAPRRRA